MAEYLKLDSRKLTYREYWNITRSVNVIVPWIAKLLGIRMNFSSGFRRARAVRDLEVSESEFSVGAREKLQPWVNQCLAVGFHSPRYFCHKTLGGESETSFIAMLHSSGESSARLYHVVATAGAGSKSTLSYGFLSELQDGTFLSTSDQPPKFLIAPGIVPNLVLKGTPSQLLDSHQRRLEELRRSAAPIRVLSADALDAMGDRYELRCNEYGIKRGIYVPVEPEEQEAAEKRAEAVQALKAEGVENADVLALLNQAQEKKSGWGNAIVILVISMFLFVGAQKGSWQSALLLVPILLVHELGHYIAMRSFKYRNLRMFFIPFFGAAVSGQHYNVAGWKKVVVSMMGPVPGIILGAALGAAGLAFHQPMMIKVALITLFLNGFNMLPILPLDGGWIFHTLLFSRHHLLDAAFRVVAVGALFYAGASTSNKFLTYLAIPMAMGIPATYRMARVVTKLRRRGVPPASEDSQTIPVETAQVIIAELKKVLPKAHTSKMVADQTMQVFETLNANPPGWLATAGLLFVHVSSMVLAGVFGLLLLAGQRGDLAGALSDAARIPKHRLSCESIYGWRGDEVITTNSLNTLIATFPSTNASAAAFRGLTNRLPRHAALAVFGQSLLLSLPLEDEAARKQWLAGLRERTKDVIVDNTNFPSSLRISFVAPSEGVAARLDSELTGYFHTMPYLSLIAPWAPDDGRSPEEREQHRLARETYLKLLKRSDTDLDKSERKALQKRLNDARSQGDKAASDLLRQEFQAQYRQSEFRHAEMVRSGRLGAVDTNLVELYVAWRRIDVDGTNTAALDKAALEIGRRMGRAGDGEANPFLARFGWVQRKELNFSLSVSEFHRVGQGAPSLVQWLCDKGCRDFRYEFETGTEREEE